MPELRQIPSLSAQHSSKKRGVDLSQPNWHSLHADLSESAVKQALADALKKLNLSR